MGDPVIAARMPARTIRDPYAGFAAIRVDLFAGIGQPGIVRRGDAAIYF
jgi:hypothetical protein